jgi:hypothetical protein
LVGFFWSKHAKPDGLGGKGKRKRLTGKQYIRGLRFCICSATQEGLGRKRQTLLERRKGTARDWKYGFDLYFGIIRHPGRFRMKKTNTVGKEGRNGSQEYCFAIRYSLSARHPEDLAHKKGQTMFFEVKETARPDIGIKRGSFELLATPKI